MYAFFRHMRATEPVFSSEPLHAWCVTRYRDIETILTDSENFSVRDHNPRQTAPVPPDVAQALKTWRGNRLPLGSLDPPEHTRVRTVVRRGFTSAQLLPLEADFRRIARDLLHRLAAEPEFDLLRAFTLPYSLAVVLRVLGVPPAHHDRCRTWTDQRVILMAGQDISEKTLRDCARGLLEFGHFARDLVAQRLDEPRDDLISQLLHHEVRGHRLSPDEVVAHIPTLITAGHESSAWALAAIVWRQVTTPGSWATLVDGTTDIDELVEESLRFDAPITGMYRTALRDLDVGRVRIPAGSRILLLFGSANHDESQYRRPDRFQPDRAAGPPHMAFGFGAHYCVGAALARTELRIALEELTAALPALAPAPGCTPTYQPVFPFRVPEGMRVRPRAGPANSR
ncbi:cytochrome P450 [Streptomyces celluloflavus]|uniref:cytochrome P450 n=1 Tax=Streptomyces celluloflavus TaxID=58344 RepID=UPI0036926BE5